MNILFAWRLGAYTYIFFQNSFVLNDLDYIIMIDSYVKMMSSEEWHLEKYNFSMFSNVLIVDNPIN